MTTAQTQALQAMDAAQAQVAKSTAEFASARATYAAAEAGITKAAADLAAAHNAALESVQLAARQFAGATPAQPPKKG